MNYRVYESKGELILSKERLNRLANLVQESKRDIRVRLNRGRKDQIIWELQHQAALIDKIIANNGLRLYSLEIPPNVGMSLGDLDQFIVKLEPLE